MLFKKKRKVEELRKKYPDHVFILVTDGQNDATIADMFDEVKVVPSNYVPGWKLLRSFVGTPKFPHEKIKGLSELLKGWTLPLGKFEEILKGIGFERASEELEREVREVLSEKSLEEILNELKADCIGRRRGSKYILFRRSRWRRSTNMKVRLGEFIT